MKLPVITIKAFLLFASCNKKKPDELIEDKAIFVGKWNWVYSTHRHNYCDGGDVVTDTLTPDTENHEFKIDFFEDWVIKYFQDGYIFLEESAFFIGFKESASCSNLSNSIAFAIAFNSDAEYKDFSGCINTDTIRSYSFDEFLFPFTAGCEDYSNYFVKE